MIKIKIEQVVKRNYTERMNLVTHEEPAMGTNGLPMTEKEYESYGGGRRTQKVLLKRDYAVVDVNKTTTDTLTLLEQEIVNDEQFNLGAVILAINRSAITIKQLERLDELERLQGR